MARQGRLHVPHATYFVVNRFAAGLDALAPSADRTDDVHTRRQMAAGRQHFERLLQYLIRRWCARVHAYCWLPQSALLLLRIGAPPLECIMHGLRGQYSAYLRAHRRRIGPAYAGRYAALLIDPDDYLLDVARHIFWSPVHAGLSRTPLGYELSSVRTCLGEPDPAALCDATLRAALRQRGLNARQGLQRFLTAAPSPGFLRLLAHGSRLDRRVVGSSAFVRSIRHRAERLPVAISRDALCEWATARLISEGTEDRGRTRSARPVALRALVAWLATCCGIATLAEVARWFRCDPSTLHRAIDRHTRLHPDLFSERNVATLAAAIAAGNLSRPSSAESAQAPSGADPRRDKPAD